MITPKTASSATITSNRPVVGRGFDAHVAPLSPYEENDPAAVRRAAEALRAGAVGLVVMDCIGFRRKTRDEIASLTGAPTLVANLLVARVAAELLGR